MQLKPMPDGKITENGAYLLPIEKYHTQCCALPSLSSSGIRRLLESPAKFWMYSDLNPDRVEEKENDALILGRAAHHLLLGEADFHKIFVVRPESLYGEKWNGNRKDCRAWLADAKDAGLTVLTPAQIEIIRGMAGLQPWQKSMPNCGLKNTDIIENHGALNGSIETSLIWKQDEIFLKSRPDAIPGTSNIYTDLKTTASTDDHDLTNTLHERSYFVQAALVGMGSMAVLGRQMQEFHLVFVDKEPPHTVDTRQVTDQDLIRGERAVAVGIEIFKRCLSRNEWPAPTAHEAPGRPLNMAQWARDSFDRRMDHLEKEYA